MQAEARSRVNLRELVYSSLEAIIDANTKMSQNMIDTIMQFSDDKGHDDDGYPIVQLKTLQLVYDQMKHDDLDMLCTEKIGLEIPILSIMPLSNLKVSKSKIQFSTEVQEMEYSNGSVNIYTKVTSPDSERSAQSSRIDFEIELESDPIAEGLSRVIDQLSQNFIPNVHEKNPIDPDGNKLSGEECADYERKKALHRREQRLNKLLAQINEMQRMDEDKTDDDQTLNIYEELKEYKDTLEEKRAEVRKQILQNDILLELDREDGEDGEDVEQDDDKPNDSPVNNKKPEIRRKGR
jgi:hypothetical protein